jgi:MFS family permease
LSLRLLKPHADRAGAPGGALKASAGPPPAARLSVQAGFWAIGIAFFVITAFSTAPSSLYGLYEQQEHIAPLTITFVYAVYAVGVVASLLLVGHVSDWYGRRPVLLSGIAIAIAADVVFLVWTSLPGLLLARVLTGVALGAAVATATAYLTDLNTKGTAVPARAGIVATIANIGGLASGPLIAGLLARYEPHGLVLPFEVFLAALVLAAIAVAFAPEGHPAANPRPVYRPQHLVIPARGRQRFVAAILGAFLCFAVFGLFAGLAGRFLAGPLHHPSPALCGLTIFLTFGAGVVVQTTTIRWSAPRVIAAGIAPTILGLALLVVSAWTSPPNLVLFVTGGIIAGGGGGAIFRGSLMHVIAGSRSDDVASALATFFVAGYLGLSVPVLALGLVLQQLNSRTTLLIFAALVAAGILAAAPTLARSDADADSTVSPHLKSRSQTSSIHPPRRPW